jgi:hypothetical protein
VWGPHCVFPSLTNDTHIVGLLIEIIFSFDHLSTQLTLVGLRVKVSKCKLWSPWKIFSGIKIPQGHTLVIDGLHILGVSVGFCDFVKHFLDEVFFSGHGTYWWSFYLGKHISCIGHFVFMCRSLTFLFHSNITSFFLFVFFGGFWQKSYVGMWGHYGSRVMGVYSRPFSKTSNPIIDLLWWYKSFVYGRLCPI